MDKLHNESILWNARYSQEWNKEELQVHPKRAVKEIQALLDAHRNAHLNERN